MVEMKNPGDQTMFSFQYTFSNHIRTTVLWWDYHHQMQMIFHFLINTKLFNGYSCHRPSYLYQDFSQHFRNPRIQDASAIFSTPTNMILSMIWAMRRKDILHPTIISPPQLIHPRLKAWDSVA